ncbi:hypothetical protein PIB30_065633 [Stylosanthes scabra]|uniref:Uncharacterized protein n=1 Tax=Stylosanthes scabra TaxID=79078 RepID=A0ABU6YJN4_9FABA|nr:hypothetical protein [Stylosanthes scabra]
MAYGKPLVATIFIVATMLSVMSFNSEARRLLYSSEDEDMDSNLFYSSQYQTLDPELNMYYPNSILILMDSATEISNGGHHSFHRHLPLDGHRGSRRGVRHEHPHKEKHGTHHYNTQPVPQKNAPHLFPNVVTP